MTVPFTRTPEGVRLSVRVAPRAARDTIAGIAADADGGTVLKVTVTAPPEAGKANAAVIRLLSKAWRIPKSSFEVVSGAGARRKGFLIRGDGEELVRTIEDWMAR